MKFLLFAVILLIQIIVLLGIGISIFFLKFRIWPPKRKSSWQFFVSWIFSSIAMIGVPLVGIFDLETLGFSHWSRFLIGGILFLNGAGLASWGSLTLSGYQSLGFSRELITSGPYRFSRNPQYVGSIIMYIGIILVLNSILGLITSLLVIFAFLILPFSEEPWLQKEYGKTYVEYCKKVPRFIKLYFIKAKK